MKKLCSIACIVLGMTACNNSHADQDKSIMQPQKATVNSNASETIVTPATTAQPVVTNAQQSAATQPVATTTAGLNPEHGMPGHRCDISVGAPLNSPVQTTKPQTVQNVQAAPIAAPSSAPLNSTAKLNPAHGEPGHDCKIPVGQPLN